MLLSVRLSVKVVVGAAILICALLFLGSRAHAADEPRADETVASTLPPDGVAEVPASTTPATGTGPNDDPNAGQDASPPADTTTAADTTPDATPDPTPDSTPPLTNDQQGDSTTTGTAVANTGNNQSGSDVHSDDPTSTPSTDPANADANVGSGDAGSTGSSSTSQIEQHANANTTEQGAVDILQVGLVINIGISSGNSGDNAAIAGAGTGGSGSATGQIDTGDASAIGNRSGTTVTQSAVVNTGENSAQGATVLNLGLAIGNTGLNVAIGTLTVDGDTAAQLATLGSGMAAVNTGDADALGNRAKSTIVQSASGSAGGRALLQIGQFAIIVNFGTAFANTGGNAAVAGIGPDGFTDQERMALQAIMSILEPILAQFENPPSGTTVGNGAAIITTGDASALGNDASTAVTQNIVGSASGDDVTSALQHATVANLGVALANTGFNAALGNAGGSPALPAANQSEIAAAGNDLSTFFAMLSDTSWLHSSNPFASFARQIHLGDLTVGLGGSITGREFLMGWDGDMFADGGPLPGGVRVRQISAVLDIALAFADSGHNLSVALVQGSHDGSDTSALSLDQGTTLASGESLALIRSGNATAIGSDSVVLICQAFRDDAACAPKVVPPVDPPVDTPSDAATPTPPDTAQVLVVSLTPTTPAPAPAAPAITVGGEEQALAADSGSLPFTGANTSTLVGLGGVMVGMGTALSRRRRQPRA